MQFSCESCKANLQIADEKVRGKRLLVRCKRCGAKIGISDPLLGPQRSRPPQASAPQQAAPAPGSSRPAPARRDTDVESTRAMDSGLLEQALQASMADETQNGVRARSAPPASAKLSSGPWFAMLHGKQAGPLTHAELQKRSDEGEVGPRTYLWKDGMDAWQRAKDIPELQSLFPQLPHSPPPRPAAAPLAQGLREFTAADFAAPAAPSQPPPALSPQPALAKPSPESAPAVEQKAAEPAAGEGGPSREAALAPDFFAGQETAQKTALDPPARAPAEPQQQKKPAPPRRRATVLFEGAASERSRLPVVMIAVIVVLAALAAAVWFLLGSGAIAQSPEKKETAAASTTPPPAPKAAPPRAQEAKPSRAQDAKPAEKAPAKPEAPAGLTADQVRRKLDENKGALQGCIDEALRRDPNLRVGKIHIATTIAPSGQVTAARVDKGAVEQSPLGACLRRATRRIAFPSFSGDAFDVDIPIVVTAGE